MTSTLSTLAEFIMVDTRLASGAVWLPLASNSQGRRITIKDAYGTFANSTCQIAASNDDLFDDSTSFKLISTNFASLSFVAVGSRWYGLSSNVFNTGTNFSSLTINLPSSIYQMDVNGIANFSSLTIRTSTLGSLFGSTVNALGNMGYVSSASLQSTVAGLGNVGYVSSASLQSTVVGLGIVTGFVSSPNLQSTVVGLGTYGYISSASLQSTVAGLGNVGYISSASLQSTVVGLGIVTGFISSPNLQSTVAGLGTYGYISSLSLQSTVSGVGSNTQSTVIGLGTYNYISSLQLISTVSGLPTAYPALTGGGTTNLQSLTVSTGNLFASSMSYVNINPSSMNMWVAVGNQQTGATTSIRYSFDGTNWNETTNAFTDGTSGFGKGVAWNGRIWVAVGQDVTSNNRIKYSSNGVNWINSLAGAFSANGNDVAWNGSLWVAVGADNIHPTTNTIKYTTNPITWDNASGSFTGNGNGVAWNGQMWVAVGSGTSGASIKYSFNGTSWSNSVSGAFAAGGNGIAWNGRIWVAVGGSGSSSIKYSSDGLNWNNAVSGTFVNSGGGVAWNGRMWVAVGDDTLQVARIKYSFDGFNWFNSTRNSFTLAGARVAWNGQYWVAVGSGGGTTTINTSVDGVFWSDTTNGFGSRGWGIAFSSNQIPAYSQSNLNILAQNIPIFLTSTNTIMNQPSSMIINNTLIIDGTWDRVGINCNIPQYALDVFGDVNVSTLSIQSTPVQNIIGSTIVGLGTTGYVSTLSLQSTIAGLSRIGYISTQSLQSTVSGLPTMYPAITGGGGGGGTNNLVTLSTGGMNASTILINTNISTIFRLDVNGPARTMMPISSLCNTSANVGLTGHGIFYYITNSGFNGITLPPTDPIGGWFVSLRNNTGTTLSVTISGTNNKMPASPFSIPPANTVTLAYDAVPPTGGCNWVYF